MAQTTEELRKKSPSEIMGTTPPSPGSYGNRLASALLYIQSQFKQIVGGQNTSVPDKKSDSTPDVAEPSDQG